MVITKKDWKPRKEQEDNENQPQSHCRGGDYRFCFQNSFLLLKKISGYIFECMCFWETRCPLNLQTSSQSGSYPLSMAL